MRFKSFDDYWKPFLVGQGPAPAYVAGLAVRDQQHLETALVRKLPAGTDGTIDLGARAGDQGRGPGETVPREVG